MDVEEVKACLRGLLSSTTISYNLNRLLHDFRQMTGSDLPLFGFLHPIEFLRTLRDTIELVGDSFNPEVALVQSNKSSHITSLVDRQKPGTYKNRYPHWALQPKRLIVPQKIKTDANDKWHPRGTSWTKAKFHDMCTLYNPPSASTEGRIKVRCSPELRRAIEYEEGTASLARVTPKKRVVKRVTFSDVSDNSSSSSTEEEKTASSYMPSTSSAVNDGIKRKLHKLIENFPDGLWCCELPRVFQEKYNFSFDFREYGYTSLIQMLSELPDVFRCIRPGNEDWILFNASVPPTAEEIRMTNLQISTELGQVTTNLRKLLTEYFDTAFDTGIEIEKLQDIYKNMFGSNLDPELWGFKDLKSLLKTWEGSLLSLFEIRGNTYVVPAMKEAPVRKPFEWKEALPPITEDNDIFIEIFPKDVVGPNQTFLEVELLRHVAVGQVVKVSVAEVWTPGLFYIQLFKFRPRMQRFTEDFQRFYATNLNKYKMPDSTIRPNQICATLYNSDSDAPEEWHRARIVKSINDKVVLVNLVDFGTITRVKKSQLRFLHRSFQAFPVQAFQAHLHGVYPPETDAKWPMATSRRFLEMSQVPFLNAHLLDIDFKNSIFSVVLKDPTKKHGLSINQILIQEKLASAHRPGGPSGSGPQPGTSRDIDEMMKSRIDAEEKNKNLPQSTDEFSDIADLGQTTLYTLKMKCLNLNDSAQGQEPKEKNENLRYEFEEVPDLEPIEEVAEAAGGEPLEDPFEVEDNQTPVCDNANNKPDELPPPLEPEVLPGPSHIHTAETSRRLPPGLENVNVAPNVTQIQSLLQQTELKKKINIRVMELFATNPSIKKVGVNDPALALQIAKEMAEASVTAELSLTLPRASESTSTSSTATPDRSATTLLPSRSVCSCSQHREMEYIRPILVGDQTVHLVTIDSQSYVCVDEIVQKFTQFPNRESADRMLQINRVRINYKIITKKNDSRVINAIKISPIPLEKRTKKMKVFLIPLTEIVPFLTGLACSATEFRRVTENLN